MFNREKRHNEHKIYCPLELKKNNLKSKYILFINSKNVLIKCGTITRRKNTRN